MIDERMGLTFSVRNNPGVYALLVGSGISRAADVPTGWEVIQDLTKQVAAAEGEELDGDPIEWYDEKYGEQPQYDDLLEQLAKSKDDRQSLLESYFEPTDEEREKGIKTPSTSHKSIAWLVKNGYIKVIVTTNFDRLLEQALEEQGITPTVISRPSEAKGAAPLAHQDAVVIKINGDYKASDLKNTADELNSYKPPMEELVRQVFDEYGLVVCGWSGEWDTALRDLVLSSTARRYSMYWASYSEPSEPAEELIAHRDGTVISIRGAGEFFFDLKERVQAIENAALGAPLTKEVARERTKRYLTRPEHRIDLTDIIQKATDNVCETISDSDRFAANVDVSDEETKSRIEGYERAVEVLVPILSSAAYWGPEVPNKADGDVFRSIKRVTESNPIAGTPFFDRWISLWNYPATLLIYSVGLAVTESEDWKLVREILFDISKRNFDMEREPLILYIHPFRAGRKLHNGTSYLKERLVETLREPMRSLFPGEGDYEEAFYEFSLLMDLALADTVEEVYDYKPEPARRVDRGLRRGSRIRDDIVTQGENWGPLQAGFLGGSEERLTELLAQIQSDQHLR